MIFSVLLLKIIPFYLMIFLGYLAGKLFHAHRETIAQILFFLITPIILFVGVVNTKLDLNVLSLPLFTFAISCTLCLLFYALSSLIWNDSTKNLMAMSAGCGNTGYLGLPIALLLFDEQGVGVYIMGWLGMTVFENSLGYYMLAKGTHSASVCLRKLAKLPALYGVLLGLVANVLHIRPPELFAESISHLKGTYTVLGMMTIGLGLANLPSLKFDYKFIGISFLSKFAAWPLLILLLTQADARWLHFFNQTIYDALLLISIVPIGINTVILSSLLKNKPEKAVIAVLLSTVFALGYIPFMTNTFLSSDPEIDREEIAEIEKPKGLPNAEQLQQQQEEDSALFSIKRGRGS